MIELKNIKKEYKTGNIVSRAVNDITVNFRKKEFVAILGPSGCGKTTLLNIIGGLDKSDEGTLKINGKSTEEYKSNDWDSYRNNTIGFVFQNFNLIPNLTIYENVELSLTLSGISRKRRKEKVLSALEKVGIIKEAYKKPNQISGGQLQRAAIARAIVNNPDIILADEPTGALDTATSKQILEILKELSKDKLVIMVTHNEGLALNYATRIINLVDGQIISDTNPYDSIETNNDNEKNKKTSMPFPTAIRISFKNLKTKIMRTLLTIIAGSIGIIGVGLVLAVSNGMTLYIDDVQRVALGNYPITVSSSVITSPEVSIYEGLTEFPNDNKVTIVKGNYKYEHINTIESEFFDYLNKMDSSLYTLINYGTQINMNILYNRNGEYRKVITSDFYEMTKDIDYVSSDYSVLSGKIPTNDNELAIVIDSYNCINASVLYYLGIDYENIESLTFEELLKLEFKLLNNNDYYTKIDSRYYTKGSGSYEELYNNASKTLKVVGVLRIKENATSEIYTPGILYPSSLTDYVYNNALSSDIVKEQMEYGLSKNVFTGEPYEDIVSLSSTTYKEYLYENTLNNLSAMKQINRFLIYTSKFEDRITIENYIKAYKNENANVRISYYDYMNRVTTEFSTFVTVLTKVLIIFASISLLVSAIMIAVITYISVIERTKEIGILRSIGARRKDIFRVFTAETLLIGFASGIIGIGGMYLLSSPINNLVKKIIADNTSLTTGLTSFNVVQTKLEYLLLLIVGSIIITVIAGFIPSLLASLKSPIKSLNKE